MTVTISWSESGKSVSTTELPAAVTLYLTWISFPAFSPWTSLPTHSPASCLNCSSPACLAPSCRCAFLSLAAKSASALTDRRKRSAPAALIVIPGLLSEQLLVVLVSHDWEPALEHVLAGPTR